MAPPSVLSVQANSRQPRRPAKLIALALTVRPYVHEGPRLKILSSGGLRFTGDAV